MLVKDQKDKSALKCFHCGELCDREHIQFEEKDFCCNGCKTVYEILKENDLCQYYDLDKFPGSNQQGRIQDKFLFLENQEVSQKLMDFASPKLNKVTFFIPKIHCSSCIWLLENLYKVHPHIIRSRVNFVQKQVSIDYDPSELTLKQLADLLVEIGYEPHISLEDDHKKKDSSQSKSLIIKIGVAGFSFGNIMLLSFPDYLGIDFLQEPHLKPFFSIVNILLALPVLLYAGNDYFKSAWKGFRKKYINIDVPIALGILALFCRSIYEILVLSQAGYLDSLAGLVFFLLIGKWFQSKTYESLSFERDYKSYFPLAVLKRNKSQVQVTPVNQLNQDDFILIRNQEIIPCDGMLLSDHANIDYSFVTGESQPVQLDKGDLIYAGGRQIGPQIEVQVIKKVSQSYLTQLWNHESFKKDKQLLSHLLINKVSKYFTITILLVAAAAFIYWVPRDISMAFNAFTAVLIVACPCALSLSVPFTYGSVNRIFGRHKFYLKHSDLVEVLNMVQHIVFDKTGTITENAAQKIEYQGEPLSDQEKMKLKALVLNSTHPLSRKILDAIEEQLNAEFKTEPVTAFEEMPGLGLKGVIRDDLVRIGSSRFIGITPSDLSKGNTLVYISFNQKVKGFFRFSHQYRPGLLEVVGNLKENYKLSLLSGDQDQERHNLGQIFPPDTNLLFRQSPRQKLDYIKNLQHQKFKVMMVGDGLNDAGALQQSDLGLAVVEDVSSFTPASDIIIQASQLKKLPDFLNLAAKAKYVILASFAISFLYNLAGLAFAVIGALTPLLAAVLMPLSSISVVSFATISVNILAKYKKLL
ncbi:MAG: heavy metal translocating P-type ATPase [Candidatus Cyclobacteriaceae bacterium M3_2C_046]